MPRLLRGGGGTDWEVAPTELGWFPSFSLSLPSDTLQVRLLEKTQRCTLQGDRGDVLNAAHEPQSPVLPRGTRLCTIHTDRSPQALLSPPACVSTVL